MLCCSASRRTSAFRLWHGGVKSFLASTISQKTSCRITPASCLPNLHPASSPKIGGRQIDNASTISRRSGIPYGGIGTFHEARSVKGECRLSIHLSFPCFFWLPGSERLGIRSRLSRTHLSSGRRTALSRLQTPIPLAVRVRRSAWRDPSMCRRFFSPGTRSVTRHPAPVPAASDRSGFTASWR